GRASAVHGAHPGPVRRAAPAGPPRGSAGPMSIAANLRSRWAKTVPFQVLPPLRWAAQRPTFRAAEPAVIAGALTRSQRRPGGNWFAFAAADRIGDRPLGTRVGGVELVAW